MPMDKTRIHGFGSDGSKVKVWHCPGGHHLQPKKARAGRCDGCKHDVAAQDPVMECGLCNWYLCNECHPQEQEQEDWFWSSVSTFIETAQQEFTEIGHEFRDMAGELETFMSDMSFTVACGAPEISQLKAGEVNLDARSKHKKVAEKRFAEKKAAKQAEASQRDAGEQEKRPRSPPAGAGSDREKTKDGAEVPVAERAVAPQGEPQQAAKPAEDLIDLGQDDLLDLGAKPITLSSNSGMADKADGLLLDLLSDGPVAASGHVAGSSASTLTGSLMDSSFMQLLPPSVNVA